jgi:hypothetical protein
MLTMQLGVKRNPVGLNPDSEKLAAVCASRTGVSTAAVEAGFWISAPGRVRSLVDCRIAEIRMPSPEDPAYVIQYVVANRRDSFKDRLY